jgi:DNA modification methylase
MPENVWKIDRLYEWDKNPRTIDQKGFARLKRQLQTNRDRYGKFLFKPLLINKDGIVIGGNMRLRALRELGAEEVEVSVIPTENEREMLDIALKDNDNAGKTEKEGLLSLIEEYPELKLDDYAVHLDTPESLVDFMDQFKEIEEDEVPEVEEGEPDSKLGKVYQLGRHRLMCGDSTKTGDVEKLMDGKKADMVFTDPPYGMDLDTDYSKIKGSAKLRKENPDLPILIGRKWNKVVGDDKPFNASFLIDFAEEVFLWGADYYNDTLPNFGKDGSWFVWDKRSEETDVIIGNTFELCWSKNKHKRQIIRYKWVGVLGMSGQDSNKRLHPTMKPIQVCSFFINNYSKPEMIILDLFGGSGSTLIACEQTNRICYMMEIDPHYCDVIRKRYENFIKSRKT